MSVFRSFWFLLFLTLGQWATAATPDATAYTWYLAGYKKWSAKTAVKNALNFQKTYSTSVHADNVLFLAGESLFLKKDYRKAVRIWERQLKSYPHADKSLAARLGLAVSYLRLGQKKQSLALLKKIVKRYSKSQEAKQARMLLKSLKQ